MEGLKVETLRYDLTTLLGVTAAWKVLVLLAMVAGAFFFPFNSANYYANFTYPFDSAPDLWTHFKTWDGQIYLYLAQEGYRPGHLANAFYPLFPCLIKAFGWVLGGQNFLAAILLSHFLTFGALFFIFEIFKKWGEARTAFFGCLFLLSYPMGFYFGLVYTEALFLFLVAGLFYFLEREQFWPGILFAFLIPMARPTGILILAPVLVWGWTRRVKSDRKFRESLFSALVIVLGFLFYLGLMEWWTLDPFSAFKAERFFAGNYSAVGFLHPLDWVRANFVSVNLSFNGPTTSVMNRFFFLIYLGVFWGSRRVLEPGYWVLALVLGLVPALMGNLGSMMRYLGVLFPLFLYAAQRVKGREAYYLIPASILQLFFALQQSLDIFVS